MISSIDLAKLRNAEYIQFQKDLIAIIQRNNPTALNVLTKFQTLQTRVNELDVLFMRMLANENTKTIEELDSKRDQAITGIGMLITSYTYHFNVALRTAAEKLNESLKVYGSGISALNYQAETATLTNLINDWETKPDLINAITTLNFLAWKNELKSLNAQFNTIYLNRTQEYGNASPETLKTKREQTNTDYYNLRDRINALHTLVETGTSPYQTVINQLNALVEQYNALINTRGNVTEETQPTE